MKGFEFPPIEFLLDGTRRYGDIFRFRTGAQRAYFISNPAYIKEVLATRQSSFIKEDFLQRSKNIVGEGLLTSEGEFYRRQRRLIQPAFHRQRIAGYGAVMAEYAESASLRWREGETIGIFEEMTRLTLRIVAKTLFNAEIEESSRDVGDALSTLLEIFNLLAFPLDEPLENRAQMDRLGKARETLYEIMYRIIYEHRRRGEDTGDLLSMLILATDNEGDGTGMTDEQLCDEAMTIFLAGHETMGNAMTWTWYLLSQHSEVEDKLRGEIRSVLTEGRLPTVADIPGLKYTEKIFTESMRIYPPVWIIGRLSIEDCEIADHRIPRDSIVLMSQYVSHRNPDYFPEPENFSPERWTEEMKSTLPPFAYFPFGGGTRRCIGEQFAWMEGILLLATIGRHWKFELAPNQEIDIQPLITLRPSCEIKMIVRRAS